MKVVNTRSPFIINIVGSNQFAIGSQIRIFLWDQYESPPAQPQYTLSKLNTSTTNKITFYNVSNYVKEYINNIKATYVSYNGDVEPKNEYTYFRIQRFEFDGTNYNIIDEVDYVGVNGFINYTDGYQNPDNSLLKLLLNPNINNYYYKQNTYSTSTIQSFNLLIDKPTTTTTIITVKYEPIDGTIYSYTHSLAVGFAGKFNIREPLTLVKQFNEFINGCKITITYTPATGSPIILQPFYTYPIEECKYTPVLCDFVNRYGAWQTITFFKAQNNSISVKGTDYKLTQDNINYNPSIGQFKTFNLNGKQTVKLNTGWVDENYSELITDLMLSETVLLDGKPVTVKTQSSDLKTYLKTKNINYEVEFEYAYNIINDAI